MAADTLFGAFAERQGSPDLATLHVDLTKIQQRSNEMKIVTTRVTAQDETLQKATKTVSLG